MASHYDCAVMERGFVFTKPLVSTLREKKGDEQFYYATKLANTKKLQRLSMTGCSRDTKPFYSKTEIDALPKHMRRGGIYGHDAVIVRSRDKHQDLRLSKKTERNYDFYIIQQ
jgi:hypothetical protein